MTISVNFAPNENAKDAWQAVKVLLTPTQLLGDSETDVRQLLHDLTGVNSEHIFLLLSARGALFTILVALHLTNGSEILVQGFTCEAVVLPIIAAKAKPIYVDIEDESWSMDISSLQKKYSNKSRVIILQHTFGMEPFYRKKILEFAASKKLFVVEDLAHGFHPQIFNKNKYHNGAFLFSFGRSKLISSVHGGAIAIKGDAAKAFKSRFELLQYPPWQIIAQSLIYKILSPFIRVSLSWKVGKAFHFLAQWFHLFTREISDLEKTGVYDNWLTKRYSNKLALTLIPNLENLRDQIGQRIKIAKIYNEKLHRPFNSLNLPIIRFPIQVFNPQQLRISLRKYGYDLGDWYNQAVAPSGLDLNKVAYQEGECRKAENICKKVVNLPTNITKLQANEIFDKLKVYL